MSHYTLVQTQIVDIDCLLRALADLGFTEVEVHAEPQPLHGFAGDQRAETAQVIIRGEFIGPLSNDIGFGRGENGAFQALISEYDRRTYAQDWLNRLAQRYAYHAAVTQLTRQGFHLVEEVRADDGQIHLVLRRLG